jgi:hypothetical protein
MSTYIFRVVSETLSEKEKIELATELAGGSSNLWFMPRFKHYLELLDKRAKES